MTKTDLRVVSDLSERHMGKKIHVTIAGADVTGELAGLIPVADTVRLVLICGGARLWTPAYPVDTVVGVERKDKAS